MVTGGEVWGADKRYYAALVVRDTLHNLEYNAAGGYCAATKKCATIREIASQKNLDIKWLCG